MNPELKTKSENSIESSDKKIDLEIERLKNEYPDITKSDYWDSLREAMIANEAFLKIIKPLTGKTPEGRSLADTDQRVAINADIKKILDLRDRQIPINEKSMEQEFRLKISQEEIDFLIEIQTARWNFKNEIIYCNEFFNDSLNMINKYIDQAYFVEFRKPEDNEINKYFKVESLGVPKILTGALVFPKNDWPDVFPDIVKMGKLNNDDGSCKNYSGINFSSEEFNDGLFSKIGLVALEEQNSQFTLENIARHEAIHQIDFLASRRSGLDILLSEFIAYRLDTKIGPANERKKGEDRFKIFINDFLNSYTVSLGLDYFKAKQVIDMTIIIIKQLKKKVGFNRVTSILLNCESFEELFQHAANLEK